MKLKFDGECSAVYYFLRVDEHSSDAYTVADDCFVLISKKVLNLLMFNFIFPRFDL